MNFKVGDIVRFKSGDYVPQWHRLTNAEYCAAFGCSLSETYEVESVGSKNIVCEGIGWNVPDRFELATKRETEICNWEADSDNNYSTSCGETFTLIDGTPNENGMKFCCYCGKKLQEGTERRNRNEFQGWR